jgi:hypothetical protein
MCRLSTHHLGPPATLLGYSVTVWMIVSLGPPSLLRLRKTTEPGETGGVLNCTCDATRRQSKSGPWPGPGRVLNDKPDVSKQIKA